MQSPHRLLQHLKHCCAILNQPARCHPSASRRSSALAGRRRQLVLLNHVRQPLQHLLRCGAGCCIQAAALLHEVQRFLHRGS